MADSEKPPRETRSVPQDSKKKGSQEKQNGSNFTRGLTEWLRRIPELFVFSWLYVIPSICILGVLVILIYSIQSPSAARWGVFAVAIVVGSSAFLIGGLVGFLFGIPRTVQSSSPSTGAIDYQGNTNLEQVSDWLTKIIVGIGLVQIGRIIPTLAKLAEALKAPLGGEPSSAAFGLGLAIANILMGFFFFYFWSRELFKRELESGSTVPRRAADPSSVKNKEDA
jgi:hypothetical protein